MRIVVHRTAREYWEAAGPLLVQREAENCLAIGIAQTLIEHPERYAKQHLFSVRDGERTVAAGWMTPPHALGLTELPSEAVAVTVEHASTLADRVPSVVAPKRTACEFKDAWLVRQGCSVSSVMAQRIFELTALVPPAHVEGTMRPAVESDRAMLEHWHYAFMIDCDMHVDQKAAFEAAAVGISSRTRYLWTVGSEPVAMVGFGGPTPSGIRVNWVYTTPERRRRGYASALVAAMSRKLLDEGRRACFLYTDLANPTSNSIYQKLGYRPVCDSTQFNFLY